MIIALDGASADLSLALADADGSPLDELRWTSAQRQSAELLPRLLEMLARNGRALSETTGLGVGSGPGSFTGLRVAMALAKGLSFALGRPLVAVPSLEAWLESAPEAVAAVARAGAHEAYVLGRGDATPIIAERETLAVRLGSRPVVASRELADAFGLERALAPRGAATIARRAAERLAADPGGDDLARLEPLYLRPPRGVATDGEPATVRWL